MSRSRWILLIVTLVLVGVATAALFLFRADDQELEFPDAGSAAAEMAEAARARAGQGPVEIRITLDVHMPADFDDGVPEREIQGEGSADFEQKVASVQYAMDKVPNSAGYLGHVEGDLSVVYEGSRFLATFRLMAKVLEGDLEWMSYELSDFSDPRVLSAGIGQLREIGLADPRLGFELIAAGVAGPPDPEGRSLVDLFEARAAVSPEIHPLIEELQDLGIQQVALAADIDADGVLTGYAYDLSYPPRGEGGRNADLTVTVEIGAGSPERIEVPPESSVERYLDFLGI